MIVTVKRHPLRRVVKAVRLKESWRRDWLFVLSCGHKCTRMRGSMKLVRCQDCAKVVFKEHVS